MEKGKIFYLCNGKNPKCSESKGCLFKGTGTCKKTSDIRYAKHFVQAKRGYYFEFDEPDDLFFAKRSGAEDADTASDTKADDLP